MKRYMLLHVGFVKPTPEIMAKWGQWFGAVADRAEVHGGFQAGCEISRAGMKELPLGSQSITGYSIITATNMEEAQRIAAENPFVDSIRVYEIAPHG